MRSLIVTGILVLLQAGRVNPIDCSDGSYSWSNQCYQCRQNCITCSSKWSCGECISGYYGTYCQSACPGCKDGACDKVKGTCTTGCKDAYYLSSGYCYNCKANCKTCTSRWNCSECNSGYYGKYCQFACSRCKNGACDKANGRCTEGCKDTYYLYNGICNQCKADCKTCINHSSCSVCNAGYYLTSQSCSRCRATCKTCTGWDVCTECQEQYHRWGSSCQHTCTGCFNSCLKSSGCQACDNKYFIEMDNLMGGNVCTGCPKNCKTCTNTQSCQSCESGHWGTICQSSCEPCKDNVCHVNLGCTSGCKDGFYAASELGRTYCYKCLVNCERCDSNTSCTSCHVGYNGATCQHNCLACNGKICNWGNGKCTHECTDNQYFDTTHEKCQNCPEGCARCSKASVCDSCLEGKWGSTCQNSCSQNCQEGTCNKNYGSCFPCKPGHWGNKCKNNCMPGCYNCRSGISCQTCKSDYFSLDNSKKCECSEEQCLVTIEASCLSCRQDEWFPHERGCCPCSDACRDNKCFANGTCVECKYPTRYGDFCDVSCDHNCKNSHCHRNGSCVSCKYQWQYGSKCYKQCSNAISQCAACYGDAYSSPTCTKCNSGYYVKENNCMPCSPYCKHGCNTTNGYCPNGCQTGWFNRKCTSRCNVTNCQSCRINYNECTECHDGFYYESQSSCLPCPANCQVGARCHKDNGSCNGCIDGYTGINCSETCYPRCKTCHQFNSTSCTVCKSGFFGDSCETNCSTGCKLINQTRQCLKTNGNCEFGCDDGLWGNACELSCGVGCNGILCNRTNGHCFSQCNDTYFGPMCDNQCSENCIPMPGRSCNETAGYCLSGCQTGWHGGQCNDQCGRNCKDGICDRYNGSCTSGCIDGYTGSMCSQALPLEGSEGSSAAAIGGGAGAGVAVLVILAIIVVVLVLRKRKTSSKLETRNGQAVEKKQSFKQTEPAGPEYSNINEACIEKETSEIPGVTNLVYANAPVRMSDVSEKEEVFNGTTKPARPTSEDYLEEVELDDNIKVDDDDADTVGVTNDTYYNMGVAVAKLAEYIKHKPIEDIMDDFEKIPKGLLKSYKEAKKAKNATKNKYRAIYPYDENRVVLLGGDGDYMNASYIDGYNRPKEYIASSGPFQKSYDTTSDFWRMIWQERCEILVMLTKPVEGGQTKCTKYWPDAGESCRYGGISITCLTEDVYADFTIRILTVAKGEESLNIRHVHFTAWPDKGIPHDVTSMIELRQKVRSLHKNKETPIIVHCSAGIGRTGTFIALDMLTYEGEGRGSVDIYGSVASLRYQRCNMVQTPEQYVYLHHAVLHSLTFDCRSIPGDMFLQNYNKLIERNGGERIIDKQFQQLQSIADEMTDEDRAQIEKNKVLSNKNRKGADVPADESRVKLHENRKPGAADYINAVYVNSFRKKKQFICAQTPLPSTVVDFLSLIHQEKCMCVVSMEDTDIQDKTIKVYWPADNQVLKHGVFKVCCKDSKTTAHYVTKKLSITYHGPNGEESRDVNLYIFTNWPKDSLVPKTSDSLLELVKTVDATNRTCEYEAPILIHCGMGANRSCLYCAVSVLIEKMEIEHEVSVVNTLRQIKARRLSAISSVEQYKFCHQAVISYLQSFDIYSNFGLKEADA